MNLQRRLDELRSERVAARRAIERLRWSNIGDLYDKRRVIETHQRFLNGSEREWQELHALLGKHLPGPPVKLLSPAEIAAQRRRSAVRAAPRVKAATASLGYMTRALMGR
jgi:hypothetical protein